MKTLFLLRHAHTHPSSPEGDKARELTGLGEKQAAELGSFLHEHNIMAEHILCSAAMRTTQTLNIMIEHGLQTDAAPIYLDSLYNADMDTLYDHIHDLRVDVQNALIVAHNPGIHQLAFDLCQNADDALVQNLSSRYNPATLTRVTFDIQSWQDVSASKAKDWGVLVPQVT